ncbi:MAG: hypothetical protein LBE80_08520, partial [Deltaproteobacteria bacterium]|nr:hypothetical protein [Deltaproteobacteria bacterium]
MAQGERFEGAGEKAAGKDWQKEWFEEDFAPGTGPGGKAKEESKYQRLKRLAWPRKWTFAVSGLLSVISSALSLAPYVLISLLIALAVNEETPLGFRHERMVDLAAVFAVLVVLRYALFFSSLILSHLAAFDILYRLRSEICAHLGKLSIGYFGLRRSGQIKK